MVLVTASAGLAAAAFVVLHWKEVAVVQEQLAWDWTVPLKAPVERLQKHFAASTVATQGAGQVIA